MTTALVLFLLLSDHCTCLNSNNLQIEIILQRSCLRPWNFIVKATMMQESSCTWLQCNYCLTWWINWICSTSKSWSHRAHLRPSRNTDTHNSLDILIKNKVLSVITIIQPPSHVYWWDFGFHYECGALSAWKTLLSSCTALTWYHTFLHLAPSLSKPCTCAFINYSTK